MHKEKPRIQQESQNLVGQNRMANMTATSTYREDPASLLQHPLQQAEPAIQRVVSNLSQGSSEGSGSLTPPRRVSISKASSLTVALSGGNPKSKTGTLRRRSHTLFGTFRELFVSIDDGDLTFQTNEDDVDTREVYSILAIREVKLLSSGSCQFQLRLAENAPPSITIATGSSGSSLMSTLSDIGHKSIPKGKVVVLKASSNREAMEWIATIKHELRNQILVCKNLFLTLQSEGHQDRAEPLFEQMLELLRVVYDRREHFEVADTLRSYGKWLEHQGRAEEAALMKRQAKAIKRRCEEGLDASLARSNNPESQEDVNPASQLPPLRRV